MHINGSTLVITNDDKAGYSDVCKSLRKGSVVKVDNKRYKILGLSSIELAFTGIRLYLSVKEIESTMEAK